MQTLLPPERFEHVVNLQPIEVENSLSTGTPNNDITSVVDHAEPHAEPSTLPDEIKDANQMDNLCTQICAYLEAPNEKKKPTIQLDSCRVNDSLLIKRDRLWMSEGKDSRLRLRMIKEIHDQLAVGHLETEQTLNMIRQHYYWLGMCGEVEQYLRNCHVCKRAKASRDAYNSFFQPLPVPERPWVDLTIDFVVGLPKSQDYDAILIVVDQLSKEKHYIPYTKDNNGTNAEVIADLFFRHIWCYHGLPISLTSNRGPQFASKM